MGSGAPVRETLVCDGSVVVMDGITEAPEVGSADGKIETSVVITTNAVVLGSDWAAAASILDAST